MPDCPSIPQFRYIVLNKFIATFDFVFRFVLAQRWKCLDWDITIRLRTHKKAVVRLLGNNQEQIDLWYLPHIYFQTCYHTGSTECITICHLWILYEINEDALLLFV